MRFKDSPSAEQDYGVVTQNALWLLFFTLLLLLSGVWRMRTKGSEVAGPNTTAYFSSCLDTEFPCTATADTLLLHDLCSEGRVPTVTATKGYSAHVQSG